jgi:hypothetical protein
VAASNLVFETDGHADPTRSPRPNRFHAVTFHRRSRRDFDRSLWVSSTHRMDRSEPRSSSFVTIVSNTRSIASEAPSSSVRRSASASSAAAAPRRKSRRSTSQSRFETFSSSAVTVDRAGPHPSAAKVACSSRPAARHPMPRAPPAGTVSALETAARMRSGSTVSSRRSATASTADAMSSGDGFASSNETSSSEKSFSSAEEPPAREFIRGVNASFATARLLRSASARPAAVAVAKNAAASGSASFLSTRDAAHAQSAFARFRGGNKPRRFSSSTKTRAASAKEDTAETNVFLCSE